MNKGWLEKDFYSILGVSSDATADEIKKTYRSLARELHPDKNPGDAAVEERFYAVTEAYNVLSVPADRNEYDAARSLLSGGVPSGASGPVGARVPPAATHGGQAPFARGNPVLFDSETATESPGDYGLDGLHLPGETLKWVARGTDSWLIGTDSAIHCLRAVEPGKPRFVKWTLKYSEISAVDFGHEWFDDFVRRVKVPSA